MRAFHRNIVRTESAIAGALVALGGIVAASLLTADLGFLIPLGGALVYGVFIYVILDPKRHDADRNPGDGAPLSRQGMARAAASIAAGAATAETRLSRVDTDLNAQPAAVPPRSAPPAQQFI